MNVISRTGRFGNLDASKTMRRFMLLPESCESSCKSSMTEKKIDDLRHALKTGIDQLEKGEHIDWEQEREFLEDLKGFREFYKRWYGFSPPKGAENFWSMGWRKGFERGKNHDQER